MANVIDILINAQWRGGSATRRAQREISGIDDTAEKTGVSMASLATKVALAGAALGGIAITARRAFDAIEEGAGLELTAQRFERLANSVDVTSDVLLGDLKIATSGMLSDAQAMALATDLIGLGLANTSDEAVRMARVVGELDADIGELTLALANQTTRRFDQLGVSLDGFNERLDRLKGTMSDEQAFTMAFLEQAEAQIEKVGGAADTTAGDIRRLQADWADLIDTRNQLVAREVGPFLSDASGRTGEGLRQIAQEAANASVSVRDLERAYADLNEVADELRQRDPVAFALFNEDDFRQASAAIAQQLALVTDDFEEFDTEARRIFGGRNLGRILDEFGVATVSAFRDLALAANEMGLSIEETQERLDELDVPADEWIEYSAALREAESADVAMRNSVRETTAALEKQTSAIMSAAEAQRLRRTLEQTDREFGTTSAADIEEAQARAERFTALPRDRADLWLGFQADITDITEREAEQRAEIEQQYEERRNDIVESYGQRRAQEEEDWNLQRLRQEQQLQRDIADIREDSAERQAEIRADTNERLQDLEEDHADRMRRIVEDASVQLEDAAGRLDAAATTRIVRDRDRALERETQAYRDQREDILETQQERLEVEQEAEAQRIEDLEESLAERQAIEEEDRRIRLRRMEQAHRDQLREIDQQNRDRLRELQQQATRERNERTRQYQLERTQLMNWWDDRQDLEADWMEAILQQERNWWQARMNLVGGGSDDVSFDTVTPPSGDVTQPPGDPSTANDGRPTRHWLETQALQVAQPTDTESALAWQQFFNGLTDRELAEWIERHSDIDVPGYLHGTAYVPRTGLAMLHEGEAVLNRQQATTYRQGGNVTIENNIYPSPGMDEQRLAELTAKATDERLRHYMEAL